MSEQIVLLGGTFDPVHFGHLLTARAVAEQRGFERITLVPTASPPHKAGPVASGADRLAMLELAIEGDPLFDICRLELTRTGPSYTLDTLQALRAEHGPDARLSWIVGADMLEGLPSWHRVGEVLEIAEIIVAARPPWQLKINSLLEKLSTQLPSLKTDKIKNSMVVTPLIEISSSDIRLRAGDGRTIRYLVPSSVDDYIREKNLY